ncbi:hypothetical protein [Undibacterium sp. Ji50W]|uniref:hypothetical protein n=1 Tax=Undibacterium sp. Ji50W TaxID=3413041 RepID=UPI003BF54ED6
MTTIVRAASISVACLILVTAAYFTWLSQNETAGSTAPANATDKNISARSANWGDSPFAHGTARPLPRVQSQDTQAQALLVIGRNGRVIDFGGKNAQEYIAQWIAAARTGDANAAYKVYQAESVCANNDEPAPEYQNPAEHAQFLRERETLRKLCANITPAQLQERMRFLTLAANAGNADAKIDFYMEGPTGKTIDLTENRDDPVVKKWKEDAVNYLKDAAGQCEPFAMGLLATAYDASEVLEHDMKLSMTYSVAESAARGRQLSAEQLKKRFGEQMTETDFADALNAGTQIAQKSCKK